MMVSGRLPPVSTLIPFPAPRPRQTAGRPPPAWLRRGARRCRCLIVAGLVVCHASGATTSAFAVPPSTAPSSAAPPAAASGTADRLRIATLNAEHLLSRTQWQAWRDWCEPRGWREAGPPPQRQPAPAGTARPPGIAYCDALNGQDWRGRQLFAPLRSEAAWADKVAQLHAAVQTAAADLLLLQEVGSEAAVRAIVGNGYRIALAASPSGSGNHQQLAIAWRHPVSAMIRGAVETIDTLAIAGEDRRITRPGQLIRLDLGPGRVLAVLNLHLKAGCRHGRLDETPARRPDRRFRRAAACTVFQQQIPPLEAAIDAELRAGHAVLVAGDFNRDLRRELRDAMPARRDRSNPAAPVTAADSAGIASLVAEISDGEPRTARFELAASGPYRKRADCHRHIDAFLLDARLRSWLAPDEQPRVVVQPWPQAMSTARIRPSDHCVHGLALQFRYSSAQGRPAP